MVFHVYVITHIASGRKYVGQSKHPRRRWWLHVGNARAGMNAPLHRAIRLYGPQAFKLEPVAQFGTLTEALIEEARLIEALHSYVGEGGLNGNRGEASPGPDRASKERTKRDNELHWLILQQRIDRRSTCIRVNEAMKATLGAASTFGVPEWAIKIAKQQCDVD